MEGESDFGIDASMDVAFPVCEERGVGFAEVVDVEEVEMLARALALLRWGLRYCRRTSTGALGNSITFSAVPSPAVA